MKRGSFGSLKYDDHGSITRVPEEWKREMGDLKTSIITVAHEALVPEPGSSPRPNKYQNSGLAPVEIPPLRLEATTNESYKQLRRK